MPSRVEEQDERGWPKSFYCDSCGTIATVTEEEAKSKIHNLPVSRAGVTLLRDHGWREETGKLLCVDCK